VRKIDKAYDDPLSVIWVFTANQLGMQIKRSPEVNASWDGKGTLTIGTPETLDPDDNLAQMILHETCHALCEGPESWRLPDWGLDSLAQPKRVHEHACLRLQAALTDLHGLRSFFGPTTNFRRYYDQLPANPLAPGDDPAISMAITGWERATQGPWSEPLQEALRRTAIIAGALQGLTSESSLWHDAPTTARETHLA